MNKSWIEQLEERAEDDPHLKLMMVFDMLLLELTETVCTQAIAEAKRRIIASCKECNNHGFKTEAGKGALSRRFIHRQCPKCSPACAAIDAMGEK